VTLYRGRGGKATDGDKVWQTGKEEYVSSPLAYQPPHDPAGALPTEEAGKADERIRNSRLRARYFKISLVLFGVSCFAAGIAVTRLFVVLMGWTVK